MKKNNPYDLTPEEADALDSTRIPDAVKAFVARRKGSIGTQTVALQKVAACARAEVEVLRAIRDLQVEHGELADREEARRCISALRDQVQMLESTARVKDSEINRLLAAPAAAVHSDD